MATSRPLPAFCSVMAGIWMLFSMAPVYAAALESQSEFKPICHGEALKLSHAGKILPLDNVIQVARDIQPGKMMEASLARDNDRYIYVIEILDEHDQIWDMLIDAVTGKRLVP